MLVEPQWWDRCPYKRKRQSPGQVAQLVGASSCTAKGLCSIPSQGTYLHCGFDPQLGHVQEATDGCFSLSSLPSKINKYNLGWGLKKKKKDRNPLSLCVPTKQRPCEHLIRKRALIKNLAILTSWPQTFQPPELWENKCLLFVPSHLWCL